MAEIVAPFEGQKSGWPSVPCVLVCELDALQRVEIRFDPSGQGTPERAAMRLLRTSDGGLTWQEIPTRLLSFWKRLDLGAFWPPDPLDLRRFNFDGTTMEVEIGEVAFAFATGGERKWRLRYDEARKGWHVDDVQVNTPG